MTSCTSNAPDPFAELHELVLVDRPLDETLIHIAQFAKKLIGEGCEVSMTVLDGAKAVTVACTGEPAAALDGRQYEAGHGPCLDAARTGQELWIHDMGHETRWPDYTPRALEAGILSSVAIPLRVQEQVIGAVNIYMEGAGALDEPAARLARTFASYAAVVLHNAQVLAASGARAHQMQEAMASRAVIEQAKGILMGQRRIGPDEAFDLLKWLSQNSNRKLHDVAQALVDTATSPA